MISLMRGLDVCSCCMMLGARRWSAAYWNRDASKESRRWEEFAFDSKELDLDKLSQLRVFESAPGPVMPLAKFRDTSPESTSLGASGAAGEMRLRIIVLVTCIFLISGDAGVMCVIKCLLLLAVLKENDSTEERGWEGG